ncbi:MULTISPECIES: opacity-associated protein OapA [Haemophilus]|uniref:Acetylglucosamine transferase n=1 Tax=Haemophilus parainfluenzae TaxID=729 RepID=A0AB37IT59_HAEPA|nr:MULTISPECIES: opacity-associated protein OapA [Haemophilus]OFQ20351.1 acetylglucosamine transferase [Haemophilus sp. HMSC073C03]RDE92412.1 acetylglucosamine transferase [Haemophilus parainfluenzae]RDF06692.1 acetylglucosamine transferase [Haemophilus parainfluenzae]
MDNKNQPNDNSSQNELDLGFNHSDSVTPRKPVKQSGSIFDKAKGLFGKKEQADTQFHVRREPTFGAAASQPFSPSQAFQSETTEQSVQSNALGSQEFVENVQVENVAEEKVIFENSPAEEIVEEVTTQAETVAPTAATAASLKSPEKWKVLQMLPEKHRRLFIAILGLVVLLIIFFTLKPNSDTVESFEQQNSNEIPVQFQSLDQSQPVETTVLDNNNTTAPATTEPSANDAKSNTPPAMEYVGDKAEVAKSQTAEPAQQTVAQQPATQAPAQPTVAPTAAKEPVKTAQPAVEKHTATVEHKAEPRREQTPVVQEKKQPKPVAEKVTAQPTQTVKKESSKIQEAKPVATKDSKVQIVEAKSATNKTVKAAEPVAQTASTGTTKTLTVPQGVSLMQVFRDNKLNISDVNAMTKASGAGSALSSFKPGDKVQVSVNSQGRVSELRLSNGGKFIRQADGSYQYIK